MIRKYQIENCKITKYDGDNMNKILKRFGRGIKAPNYILKIVTDTDAVRHFAMIDGTCGNKKYQPLHSNDATSKKEQTAIMKALLLWERKYGEQDSFYNTVISQLEKVGTFYAIDEKMHEIHTLAFTEVPNDKWSEYYCTNSIRANFFDITTKRNTFFIVTDSYGDDLYNRAWHSGAIANQLIKNYLKEEYGSELRKLYSNLDETKTEVRELLVHEIERLYKREDALSKQLKDVQDNLKHKKEQLNQL